MQKIDHKDCNGKICECGFYHLHLAAWYVKGAALDVLISILWIVALPLLAISTALVVSLMALKADATFMPALRGIWASYLKGPFVLSEETQQAS